MKVLVLYRPNTEHGRLTEEFVHDYRARHAGSKLEVLNLDTREGDATATLYGVLEYPAILIVQDNGYVSKMWQGTNLPRLDDVASYLPS